MDNNDFESYYNALQDYRLYREFCEKYPENYYDPNEDLPADVHASICRPEPEIEDDPDPNEPEIPADWQPSDDPLHF